MLSQILKAHCKVEVLSPCKTTSQKSKRCITGYLKTTLISKYGGKTVGKMVVHDRGLEWLAEGHGFDMSKLSKRDGGKGYSSMMYRIPATSSLQFPNKFVGPEKCGECHPAQYEVWSRSRHATTMRFPWRAPRGQ